MSVFGPIHEKDYQPITETDVPKPDTAYGLSKLHTEEYLASLRDFPYVIFRPTGVYGPRERDYFLMAKSIRNHVDFMAGFRRQDLTFVFVKDLVQAIYLAIDKQVIRRSYFVTDGDVYSSRTFSDLIRRCIQQPYVFRPDTEGIGKSLDVPFHLSVVVAESDFVRFGKRREIASQAEYAELRQIQNHEAAQLAV